MNRTFGFGLVAAGLGLAAAVGYELLSAHHGICGGLFGVAPSARPCSGDQAWTTFLNMFAMVTLALTIVFGFLCTRVYAEDEGYVSLGDSFLAIGTLVLVVEVALLVLTGTATLGIAACVAGVALTILALRRPRGLAMGAASLMGLGAAGWLAAEPASLLLAGAPAALWLLAALAYASSLKVGEPLVYD